ncbi:MAG: hypothetical protein ACNA71_05180 [Kiritimatiellia bacterium]
MTGLDVIQMNRSTYKRMSRRSDVFGRIFGLMRTIVLVLAIVWSYTSRTELMRMVNRVWQPIVVAQSAQWTR